MISAGLLGFYVYTLTLGAHPKVSYEYRGFYLDHTLKYKPREGSLAVRPGVKLYLNGVDDSDDTFYGVGRGWAWEYSGHAMENTGYCYTDDIDNYLYFTDVDLSRPHSLRLHVNNDCSITARAYAGDVLIADDLVLEQGELMLDIPPMEDPSVTGDSETGDINELAINISMEEIGRAEVDYLVFD